jgi:hypothetical protein
MPFYRGVEQSVVVQSINDIVDLLKKNPSGPVVEESFKDFSSDKIAQATTDIELAQAVSESGICGRLCWIHDLLLFHAINDTGGKGREVYKTLMSWDAASGARAAVFDESDAEIEAYIAKNSTLSFRFKKASLGVKEWQVYADEMPQDDQKKTGVISRIFNRVKATAEDAAGFARLFFGKEMPFVTFGASSSLGRYGLVIDDLTEGKINWRDPACAADREKVEQILAPFYELDEVESTGIGLIGNFQSSSRKVGVVFDSTRRVAEAVAAAFPDRVVLDEKSQPVTAPKAPPGPAATPLAPQP